MFLDWCSGYQKDPALWREWMSAAVEAAAVKIQAAYRGRLLRRDSQEMGRQYEAMPGGALYVSSDSALARMAGGEQMVAERRAYEASRSGEQKAAFGRMLENTMVSTRQPLSQPDSATTCTALTARWLYIPR